jgi:hypothetical protein
VLSRHIICDFYHRKLSGSEQDIVTAGALIGAYEWAADYHPAYWERIVEVIGMAQEFEGPLATIAVDSRQRIAAKRRKHTKPDADAG